MALDTTRARELGRLEELADDPPADDRDLCADCNERAVAEVVTGEMDGRPVRERFCVQHAFDHLVDRIVCLEGELVVARKALIDERKSREFFDSGLTANVEKLANRVAVVEARLPRGST